MTEYWMPYHLGPSFKRYKKRKIDNDDMNTSMGFLLPYPKTDLIDNENVVINNMEIGHSSMQGYRINMEDAHVIEEFTGINDHTLVGVFDGHGFVVLLKPTYLTQPYPNHKKLVF